MLAHFTITLIYDRNSGRKLRTPCTMQTLFHSCCSILSINKVQICLFLKLYVDAFTYAAECGHVTLPMYRHSTINAHHAEKKSFASLKKKKLGQ